MSDADRLREIANILLLLPNYTVGLDEPIERCRFDINAIADRLHETQTAMEVAEYRLRSAGYRKTCNIPACNCGDIWGHGGHANKRLREISEALEGRDNGGTILKAVEELMREIERMRGTSEKVL
ncbi:MAG: hypothetical protein OES09_05545 [Gammaproteobacteria bacterium]|nr:hypothetical protein [Gammaproteobacteria bacterium]